MRTQTKPLGPKQQSVLDALRRHGGSWPDAGWIWGTYGETQRILEALVNRGLVAKEMGRNHANYRIVEGAK